MNLEKIFQAYLRGWFPSDPALQARTTSASSQGNLSPEQRKNRRKKAIFMLIWAFYGVALGTIAFYIENYVTALILFIGVASVLITAYGVYKYAITIKPRFVGGVLCISIGAYAFLNVDFVNGMLAVSSLFAVSQLQSYAGIAIFIGEVAIILAIGVWLLHKLRLIPRVLDRTTTRRQLLKPFTAIAMLLLATYLVIISGVHFDYAIPLAFILIGILEFGEWGRFAINIPTFIALLFCILFLATAMTGAYTVTYVPENHQLTTAQTLNVNVMNVTVTTYQADIQVYFTNYTNQVCQVSFVKQYGPTVVGKGIEFHSQDNYNNFPVSNFSYSLQDQQILVHAESYRTFVNVTLSQNLKCNLNLYSVFGGITVHMPPSNGSIQSSTIASKWGYAHTLQGGGS
jgi:hypothetical protein